MLSALYAIARPSACPSRDRQTDTLQSLLPALA